jgi:PilZ domain
MREDSLNGQLDAGARFGQTRAMPRYPLVAEAQIYEPLSRTRLHARTTEIGLNGCYVEVVNSLPRNTILELLILRNGQEFRTWARVAYVRESIGMGLAFLDTRARHRQTIRDWIRELKP